MEMVNDSVQLGTASSDRRHLLNERIRVAMNSKISNSTKIKLAEALVFSTFSCTYETWAVKVESMPSSVVLTYNVPSRLDTIKNYRVRH